MSESKTIEKALPERTPPLFAPFVIVELMTMIPTSDNKKRNITKEESSNRHRLDPNLWQRLNQLQTFLSKESHRQFCDGHMARIVEECFSATTRHSPSRCYDSSPIHDSSRRRLQNGRAKPVADRRSRVAPSAFISADQRLKPCRLPSTNSECPSFDSD